MDNRNVDTPLLSVVMPVYNVAAFLPRCLDSLIAQTRPIDELVVVDDGSTDECPRILSEYAARLPQMRVIRQENSGLSEARNTGIRNANGRYLAFIDSDDFVAPEMYGTMLSLAMNDDLDMVICNANYHFEGREPDRPIYPGEQSSGVLSGKEWLQKLLRSDRLMHMVWMHLYRRDFIVQQSLTFIPRIIHEDVIWTTEVLLSASRVRFIETPLYHYRVVIRRYSPEILQDRLRHIVDCSVLNARTLARIAADPGIDNDLRDLLLYHMVDGAFSVFHKLDKMPDRSAMKTIIRRLRHDGWFGFLWENAHGFSQHRKIARRYLYSLFI